MNCVTWEEKIALYAGGDLAADEAAKVEGHLDVCLACHGFADDLKRNLAALQQAHDEPILAAHFAAVRARVMAEIEAAQVPWWRSIWALGTVAAVMAALVILTVWPKRSTERRVAPQVAAAVQPEAPVAATPAAPTVKRHSVSAPRRVRKQPGGAYPEAGVHALTTLAESGPPLTVKLVTDDPNVVIYWISGAGGE